jgi:hypothetical protein
MKPRQHIGKGKRLDHRPGSHDADSNLMPGGFDKTLMLYLLVIPWLEVTAKSQYAIDPTLKKSLVSHGT